MRLDRKNVLDTVHGRFGKRSTLSHGPTTPMRAVLRPGMKCFMYQISHIIFEYSPWSSGTKLVIESLQALLQIPSAPFTDRFPGPVNFFDISTSFMPSALRRTSFALLANPWARVREETMDSNCFLSSTVKLTFGDSRPRFMGIFLPFLNFGIMPVSRYKKRANYLIFCKKINLSANVFLGHHTSPGFSPGFVARRMKTLAKKAIE